MPVKLGVKLKRIRESLGLTQEELSKAVALSSEFISLIEIGKRAPSLVSLRKIAGHLKKDISYFLTEEVNAFDILLHDKKLGKKAKYEIKKFRSFCEDYLKLEEITGKRLEIAPQYHTYNPEKMAEEERRRLGIGDEPIKDIFLLLEMNGLRILRKSLPSEVQIAGLFVFFEAEQAAFALVNNSQPYGQQALMAAHAYCHYLKDRTEGPILDNFDILIDEYVPLYHPREKFAQEFALNFILPQKKLGYIILKELRTKRIKFEDVIYLKRYFGININVMLKTLHKLGYLPFPRFNEFSKIDHLAYEKSLFGDLIGDGIPSTGRGKTISSDRYLSLGVTAYQKNPVSGD